MDRGSTQLRANIFTCGIFFCNARQKFLQKIALIRSTELQNTVAISLSEKINNIFNLNKWALQSRLHVTLVPTNRRS